MEEHPIDKKPLNELIKEYCKHKNFLFCKVSSMFEETYTINVKNSPVIVHVSHTSKLEILMLCNKTEYLMKLEKEDEGQFIVDCFYFITRQLDEC